MGVFSSMIASPISYKHACQRDRIACVIVQNGVISALPRGHLSMLDPRNESWLHADTRNAFLRRADTVIK